MFLGKIARKLLIYIALFISFQAQANDNIKIGILHSLSGNMANYESSLKDVLLMMIKEVNDSGGILGKKLEAVVFDTRSDWPTFSDKAHEMLDKENVSVIFGCWTSISRKHVKPVVEQHNSLLFYPLQYEGEESSTNIIYTGGTPNQHAIPALEYLLSKAGGGYERFYLVGEDYLFPKSTIKIMKSYLTDNEILEEDIKESFTSFENKDWNAITRDIKDFSSKGKKTAVVTLINGNANKEFYTQIKKQELAIDEIPIVAISLSEGEIAKIGSADLEGTYVVSNYFMNIDNELNKKYINKWAKFSGIKNNYFNDAMESTVLGFSLWINAVKKAKSAKAEDVLQALPGSKIKSLSGYEVHIDDENNHIHKPVFIGKIEKNGKIKIVFESNRLIEPKN